MKRSMMRLGLATALALSGCGRPASIAVSHCDWRTSSGCSPLPATCRADGPLPDSLCTPGALNPEVTQAMIDLTICAQGWTRTVRPPVGFTTPLKRELMTAYGVGSDLALFELDHLIPLELGGALADSLNLWPESHEPRPGSYEKDGFEDFLNVRVCARELSLAEAQDEIANDWLTNWKRAGSPANPFAD